MRWTTTCNWRRPRKSFQLLRRPRESSLPDPVEAVEGPFLAELSEGAGSMPSVQTTWNHRDEDKGGVYE
jgi:hypothetical protein